MWQIKAFLPGAGGQAPQPPAHGRNTPSRPATMPPQQKKQDGEERGSEADERRRRAGLRNQEARRAARLAKGKSIEERPREVNEREEIGHWEMDTVLSAKEGSPERVLALTGRVTRNQINIKI